jgi:hypothetical protein
MTVFMCCRVLVGQPKICPSQISHRPFVTAVIDTDANRDNIKTLYSNLESTSAQIDVSA